MPDIVLATLNAQYIHASFGLRYLLANLGELRSRACLLEFTIAQHSLEIVEIVLAHQPRIAGFGVYVWNVEQTARVVALLKRLRPSLTIVLGGPEVSYETGEQAIVGLADHVIAGEADRKFGEVCRAILEGAEPSFPKILRAEPAPLHLLASPYDLYTDEDLAQRVIYVEASRGCPFACEFCLSALEPAVRSFPVTSFLDAMQRLLDRGARRFKFVDRTFNLDISRCLEILQFFLDHWRDGLFLHFEMIPGRLPEPLRTVIRRFPPGALQFELGIQSYDELALENISRRQDLGEVDETLRFLREETEVHVHADLILGLPGEGMQSFGRGFDRLVKAGPQEIQVGVLKRLRGAPIVRHDEPYRMIYAPHPPYEVLSTLDIPFPDMQRMKRFARYWDIIANSGNFQAGLQLLWRDQASPFEEFLRLSDWLYATLRRTHQIALHVVARCLFEFLTREAGLNRETVASALEADWQRVPSRSLLNLRGLTGGSPAVKPSVARPHRRQARHVDPS